MSAQIAQKIPFHPSQCLNCINYAAAANRCRAFAVDSWPSPLLAVFDGETDELCSRFFASKEAAAEPELELSGQIHGTSAAPEAVPAVEAESHIPAADEASESAGPFIPEPAETATAIAAEKSAPPPERGEPRIHCHKCRTENPPGADRCQQCNASLLPGESPGTRITGFFTLMLIAGGLAYLFYIWYILSPESAPNIPILDPILNPIVLGLAALIALVTAIVQLLRRTPDYVRYRDRATRHEMLNPWQSLEDLDRAMDLAPEKELGKLLTQRAKLYESLGLKEDAARDYLVLLTSPGRFKGEADAVSLFTGADAGTYEKSRRGGEIHTLLASGKAKAVGYCPQCDLVVELDDQERCMSHPKVKGREVEYVIPADVTAGKLKVMQKLEPAKLKVSEQISQLLVDGQAVVIGNCPKCTGVVELTPERRCRVHPKARITNLQYAVPRDLPEARKRIYKARKGKQKSGYRIILYLLALLSILYAIVVLMDIDLSGIFQR